MPENDDRCNANTAYAWMDWLGWTCHRDFSNSEDLHAVRIFGLTHGWLIAPPNFSSHVWLQPLILAQFIIPRAGGFVLTRTPSRKPSAALWL